MSSVEEEGRQGKMEEKEETDIPIEMQREIMRF